MIEAPKPRQERIQENFLKETPKKLSDVVSQRFAIKRKILQMFGNGQKKDFEKKGIRLETKKSGAESEKTKDKRTHTAHQKNLTVKNVFDIIYI